MEGIKRAPILSAFVDHVLKTWVQEAVFLDNAKLMAVWNSWWGSRKVRAKADMEATSKNQNGGNNNNGGGKPKNKQQGKGGGGGQKGWQAGNFQQGGQGGPNRIWQGGPQQGWNTQVPRFTASPCEANICRRYNEKACQRSWQNCMLNTSACRAPQAVPPLQLLCKEGWREV